MGTLLVKCGLLGRAVPLPESSLTQCSTLSFLLRLFVGIFSYRFSSSSFLPFLALFFGVSLWTHGFSPHYMR